MSTIKLYGVTTLLDGKISQHCLTGIIDIVIVKKKKKTCIHIRGFGYIFFAFVKIKGLPIDNELKLLLTYTSFLKLCKHR